MTSRVAQLAQAIPDEEARRRIEARRRLVEEEHLGRVHERAGDHHALRLPTGEEVRLVASRGRGGRTGRAARRRGARARAAGTPWYAAWKMRLSRIEIERSRLLRCGTTASCCRALHRLADDVDPADSCRAGGRPDAGRQHADRRRLPRSVRAEQPEHLAGGDGERDAVDGVHRRLRIPLDEIDDFDNRLGRHLEIVGPALVDRRHGVYFRDMDALSNRTIEGRKTVTVVFCDLVAYTELAGRLDPEALRHVMLRFFEHAAGVIEGHGGTVEKFVGDEVMAVFGVPIVHEDDALRAVRSASRRA